MAIFLTMLLAGYASADTALVKDGGRDIYRASKNTIKEARAAALAFCRRESKAGKCKVAMESKPKSSGYGAVAQSKTRTHMSLSYETEGSAEDAALKGCVARTATDDVCNIVMTFHDDTHPASSQGGGWHPKGPVGKVLRYSDNCYNGDCVRTFQDGKKVRFQAPHCFDGVAGEWKWKPDGC